MFRLTDYKDVSCVVVRCSNQGVDSLIGINFLLKPKSRGGGAGAGGSAPPGQVPPFTSERVIPFTSQSLMCFFWGGGHIHIDVLGEWSKKVTYHL